MTGRVMRGIQKAGRAIRDTWLILGVVAIMVIGLEAAYRAQGSLRRAFSSGKTRQSASKHPYADSSWFPQFEREEERTYNMRWKPYVYFRRGPFRGTHINVDSLGRRRTLPVAISALDTLRVFFFGGSTMWGTGQRDGQTIASVAASRLAKEAPAGTAVDVTNFGETGYVSTQEATELQVQLRARNIPHVAVFFDGINDVASAAQAGEAGVPQNELSRAREFALGRAIYAWETGAGSEWRAARAIAGAAIHRFQFIQRLITIGGKPFRPTVSHDSLATATANAYVRNADIVEALSRAFGFRVMYIWQPTLATTKKAPTPYESGLIAANESDPFFAQLARLHRAIIPMLDTTMRERVGTRFVNQATLFTGDTSSVFLDQIGHNTEKSIGAIVAHFYPVLAMLADSARANRRKR